MEGRSRYLQCNEGLRLMNEVQKDFLLIAFMSKIFEQ